MRSKVAIMQVGKSGLTAGFIDSLKNAFKTRGSIKISVLKSAGHTKDNVKKIAEEIISSLGGGYNYRVVGFAIFIKKSKRSRQS